MFEEATEELHSGNDAGGVALFLDHPESVGPFEKEVTQGDQWGRCGNRRKLGVHDRPHRPFAHAVGEGAVEDLARNEAHQRIGFGVAHRQGVDPELVDALLGVAHGYAVVDGEDRAGGDVNSPCGCRKLLGEGLHQLLAHLHRHRARDAGRSGGRVSAASEALGHLAHVQAGQARPQDEVDVGRAHQHHRADADLEDLDPAVDHEGGLFVVAIHLEHGQGYGDLLHDQLLGRLHHAVEELELLRLQGLEYPPPNPFQHPALFEEPGGDPQVLGGGLAVGQAAGVLVDPH